MPEKQPTFLVLESLKKNHVRNGCGADDNSNDVLVTGRMPTLHPGDHKPRADMQKSDEPFPKSLTRIWESLAAESIEMRHDWDKRQNEWRVPLDDGSYFVIRLTEAASPHTKKRFTGKSGIQYSGMIMVWFGKENCTGEPIIVQDKTKDAGISFFSNQDLIEQYPILPAGVQHALAQALGAATGFLQDELNIPDEEVGSKLDITMGIGSRLQPEVRLGKQGQGSQSGPWGHLVVVYHDDDERNTQIMPLHESRQKEIVKVMDPWVELITQHFSDALLASAQQALSKEKAVNGILIKLQPTWDGLSIQFPESGVSTTEAYSCVSAIYRTYSSIHQDSVAYYERFRKRDSTNTKRQSRGAFVTKLVSYGISEPDANRYVAFLESLSPSYAVVSKLLKGKMNKPTNVPKLEKVRRKIAQHNEGVQSGTYKETFERRRDHVEELYHQQLLLEKLHQTDQTFSMHDADLLKEQLVTLRTRRLASYLRNQLLVDPAKHPKEIESILPLSKLTGVVVAKDFTYEPNDGLLIQSMRFALSFAGRGGFEVMTETGQIVRERPV